jgi:hypothetical protein
MCIIREKGGKVGMIIAQSIFVSKEQIPALVTAFQAHGYAISNYQSDLVTHIAFDVSKEEEELSFFRFERSEPDGDITGLRTLGDTDVLGALEVMVPFVQEGSYVLFTGEHQCELEGYYVGPDGVYEAVNVRVLSERGQKM